MTTFDVLSCGRSKLLGTRPSWLSIGRDTTSILVFWMAWTWKSQPSGFWLVVKWAGALGWTKDIGWGASGRIPWEIGDVYLSWPNWKRGGYDVCIWVSDEPTWGCRWRGICMEPIWSSRYSRRNRLPIWGMHDHINRRGSGMQWSLTRTNRSIHRIQNIRCHRGMRTITAKHQEQRKTANRTQIMGTKWTPTNLISRINQWA